MTGKNKSNFQASGDGAVERDVIVAGGEFTFYSAANQTLLEAKGNVTAQAKKDSNKNDWSLLASVEDKTTEDPYEDYPEDDEDFGVGDNDSDYIPLASDQGESSEEEVDEEGADLATENKDTDTDDESVRDPDDPYLNDTSDNEEENSEIEEGSEHEECRANDLETDEEDNYPTNEHNSGFTSEEDDESVRDPDDPYLNDASDDEEESSGIDEEGSAHEECKANDLKIYEEDNYPISADDDKKDEAQSELQSQRKINLLKSISRLRGQIEAQKSSVNKIQKDLEEKEFSFKRGKSLLTLENHKFTIGQNLVDLKNLETACTESTDGELSKLTKEYKRIRKNFHHRKSTHGDIIENFHLSGGAERNTYKQKMRLKDAISNREKNIKKQKRLIRKIIEKLEGQGAAEARKPSKKEEKKLNKQLSRLDEHLTVLDRDLKILEGSKLKLSNDISDDILDEEIGGIRSRLKLIRSRSLNIKKYAKKIASNNSIIIVEDYESEQGNEDDENPSKRAKTSTSSSGTTGDDDCQEADVAKEGGVIEFYDAFKRKILTFNTLEDGRIVPLVRGDYHCLINGYIATFYGQNVISEPKDMLGNPVIAFDKSGNEISFDTKTRQLFIKTKFCFFTMPPQVQNQGQDSCILSLEGFDPTATTTTTATAANNINDSGMGNEVVNEEEVDDDDDEEEEVARGHKTLRGGDQDALEQQEQNLAHFQTQQNLAHFQTQQNFAHLQAQQNLAHLQMQQNLVQLQTQQNLVQLQMQQNLAHLQMQQNLAHLQMQQNLVNADLQVTGEDCDSHESSAF